MKAQGPVHTMDSMIQKGQRNDPTRFLSFSYAHSGSKLLLVHYEARPLMRPCYCVLPALEVSGRSEALNSTGAEARSQETLMLVHSFLSYMLPYVHELPIV